MSESKKSLKEPRVELPVSKTNLNRVKYQTHTLASVLAREGYKAQDGFVIVGQERVHLSRVDLVLEKQDTPPPKKTEPSSAGALRAVIHELTTH